MALSSADKLKILIALLLEYETTAILLPHKTMTILLIIPLLARNKLWQKLIEAENKDDASWQARQACAVSGVNLLT